MKLFMSKCYHALWVTLNIGGEFFLNANLGEQLNVLTYPIGSYSFILNVTWIIILNISLKKACALSKLLTRVGF